MANKLKEILIDLDKNRRDLHYILLSLDKADPDIAQEVEKALYILDDVIKKNLP